MERMLTGKQVSRELPTKDTGIYNPLYPKPKFFIFINLSRTFPLISNTS